VNRAVATALALLPLCAAATPVTTPEACVRLGAEIERAEQARQAAVEKGDTAWKTVLPFAVVARKVSAKAAADEAAKQIAELRQQAQREGCDAF
jgi:hypothetical protein